MSKKQRLSVTIDADLIAVAEAAVKRRDAATVSAWVNDAMRLKRDHDGRQAALAAAVADYERRHGVITQQDMDDAYREAMRRARSVRGLRAGESRRRFGK